MSGRGILYQNISILLNNKKHSDVQFIFKNSDVKCFAHKFILRITSDVFDKMFSSSRRTTGKDAIELTDIRPDNFLQVLTFIYTDEVTLTDGNLSDILRAAHKYKIDQLASACRMFLIEKLNDDTVTLYLEQFFDYESLAEICLKYIDDAIDRLLKNDKLYNLSETAINLIVKRDTLGVNESHLFKFLIEWAEKVSKKRDETRSTLKLKEKFDFFNTVRFPSMTTHEFDECLKFRPEFFSCAEIGNIYKYLSTGVQDSQFLYPIFPRTQKIHKVLEFGVSPEKSHDYKYVFEFSVKTPLTIKEFHVLIFRSFLTHVQLYVNDGTVWQPVFKGFIQNASVITCDPPIQLFPTKQYKLKSLVECNDRNSRRMCIYVPTSVPNNYFHFPTNLKTFVHIISFEVQGQRKCNEPGLKRKRSN